MPVIYIRVATYDQVKEIREQIVALRVAGIDLHSVLNAFEAAVERDFLELADVIFMDTPGFLKLIERY
jgi:signal recognition particle GTPase